ncbi:hypothetical protein PL263_03520 [Methylomonas sp. EFPC3]|uniref:hypothetical protein n=1 Tax=Methylomonas sp. EFPC3 TaxID=3021710 RepID=UPI0024177DF1|nr:hypothetical protein [Methylomonas sp. EFPC3]WFP51099.1 hypothetical protein PL263_03520 [Methylomonas sp. EFPC3]
MKRYQITWHLPAGLLLALAVSATVSAAPREASKDSGAVLKLQGMVKSLTAERDAAQAETAKLNEQLKQLEQLKKEHSAAVAAKEQLGSELSAQRNAAGEVRERLEKSNARLQEAFSKNQELSQAKAELAGQLAALKGKQQITEQQLNVCGEHNLKLYEAGKDLLQRYQNKGALSGLLEQETLLQFNSVEMENIVQEYEDKLRAGKLAEQTAAEAGIPAQ